MTRVAEKTGLEQPRKYWTPSPALSGMAFYQGDRFPKWRGNMLVEDRLYTLGYLGLAWGQARVLEYAAKLKDQQPKFVRGAQNVVQGIASGQAAIGLGAHDYLFLNFKNKGAPVELVPTDVIGVDLTGVVMIKGGPHPNAAKLWAGWITSPEAETVGLRTAPARGPNGSTASSRTSASCST